jgi:hypothetical protein
VGARRSSWATWIVRLALVAAAAIALVGLAAEPTRRFSAVLLLIAVGSLIATLLTRPRRLVACGAIAALALASSIALTSWAAARNPEVTWFGDLTAHGPRDERTVAVTFNGGPNSNATRAVAAIPGIDDVNVTLVWDPPWSVHRISEAARLELGLL